MADVVVERSGQVARVILNRPEKRNAQTVAMWTALREAGQSLEEDREVRVVLVSGRGPAFSAGIDLGLLLAQATDPTGQVPAVELVQQSFTWLRQSRLITIAAVQGAALGAGMQLALACDLRILAEDAVLGLPEVNFGILPDLGGCAWLPELVGSAKAKELIFLAERIDARAALQLGLANQVVPNDDLESVAVTLAGRLAERAPLALAGAKRAINASLRSPDEALQVSAEELRRCFASRDFKELGRAMSEKRPPVFEGR
jgi:enoyl-CoA hydratase/carnithine racemase